MSLYKAKVNPFTGDMQLVFNGSLIVIKESVDTYNNLPITGNNENDLRIAQDTDIMYTWSIPAASGILANWLAIGSASSVDWSAITNKPSSAVADIDDAVSKKHTQNTDTKLDEGGTNEKSVEDIIISDVDGDLKKITKLRYNSVTGEMVVYYEE